MKLHLNYQRKCRHLFRYRILETLGLESWKHFALSVFMLARNHIHAALSSHCWTQITYRFIFLISV